MPHRRMVGSRPNIIIILLRCFLRKRCRAAGGHGKQRRNDHKHSCKRACFSYVHAQNIIHPFFKGRGGKALYGGALHLPFGKIQKRQRIARSIFRAQKPQRPFVTKSFQISVKVPERYPHKRIKPPGAHRRKSHQFDCGVAVADMYIFMRQNKAKLLFFAIRRKHDFRLDNAYAERRACRVAREQRYSAGFIKALKNCVCGVAFFVLKAVAASQHIGMTYAKVCRKQHRSANMNK